jgi:hypothetical protein
MYTTSIKHIQQALRQLVESFEGVEAFKVEFSLWDHTTEPIMQLYVLCTVHNRQVSIHTRSQTLTGALQEIEDWYQNLSGSRLAMAS